MNVNPGSQPTLLFPPMSGLGTVDVMKLVRSGRIFLCFLLGLLMSTFLVQSAELSQSPLQLTLRSRAVPPSKRTSSAMVETNVTWNPRQTAIIICDMWDDHWCKSAARRVTELAGPMNELIRQARARGVFIIHAPSSVTKYYEGTPQRDRARQAPFAQTKVPLSTAERWGTAWCWPEPAREQELPIDDSDMGCDCRTKCAIREAWTR